MGPVTFLSFLLMNSYVKEKKRGEIMEIYFLSFKLSIDRANTELEKELFRRIEERNMACYYREVCIFFNKKIDEEYFNTLKARNEKVVKEMKEKVEEKKRNGSENDVLDTLISLVYVFFDFYA